MTAFDRLCWFAERYPECFGPLLPRLLREAALFLFEGDAHRDLPKRLTETEAQFHLEHFGLPFPVTAVEDHASCVLLWGEDPNAVGLNRSRAFVECANIGPSQSKHWSNESAVAKEYAEMSPEDRRILDGSYHVSSGILEEVRPDATLAGYSVRGTVTAHQYVSPDGEVVLMPERADSTRSILQNAHSALEELMHFNRPDRFIVESSPKSMRSNSPKIPRAHQRPNYVLLEPTAIRRLLRAPGSGDGPSKASHSRRRHVRCYPDDASRWPHRHGQSVVIQATWVGPSQAQVGNRIYKVLLDR